MATSHLHARISKMTWLIMAIMALLVMRLFFLQVIEHKKYVALAQSEQVRSLVIPASRGEIYAMNGSSPTKMVLNEVVFTVYVDPTQITNPTHVASEIRTSLGSKALANIDRLVRAKPSQYQVVAKGVTYRQAAILKQKQLAGIGFTQTTQRVYPEGQLASQTLGFVNANGSGQYGVEQALNTQLKGKDGMRRSVTDISNVPLTLGSDNIDIEPQNGKNIALTIDVNIQAQAEEVLAKHMQTTGATEASMLVMDPQSGKVLAMANAPSYNPTDYAKITNARLFGNPIIDTPYEPASVLKTYSMSMGIDKGIVSPSSTYYNSDRITIGPDTIENAEKGDTGTITMQEVLNNSLNTGTVTLLERMGGQAGTVTQSARQTMYQYYHDRFGLGQDTGIQLAGEVPGGVIPPTNVEGSPIRYANMTFGQGLEVTTLQVASGFCSIINGGNYYKPTIIAGTVDRSGNLVTAPASQPVRHTISSNTSATMRQMLETVRAKTAPGVDPAGYSVGGKTGTAQTIVDGKYNFQQTVATYLGYGGDTKPRYVIMVKLFAPGKNLQGNIHARPTFTDMSNWLIPYLQLHPRT